MFRTYACPGWLKASDGLPETSGVAAEDGKRLHKYLEICFENSSEPLPELQGWEQKVVNTFIIRANEIMNQHGGAVERHVEESFKWREIESITPDLWVRCADNSVHVWDWKFNYLEVDTAERNLQLRTAAVALGMMLDVADVYTHLFAAGNKTDNKFSTCHYEQKDIRVAYREQQKILELAMDKDAKRCPDLEKQCKYCPACGNPERCPESVGVADQDYPVVPKGETLPSAQLKELYIKCKQGKAAIKKFEEWLKGEVMKNPDNYPDFLLVDGSKKRSITNIQGVYEVGVALKWWNQEQFIEAVSISAGDIEKLVKQNTGQKLDVVKSLVNERLAEFIEYKQDKPSLEVKGE